MILKHRPKIALMIAIVFFGSLAFGQGGSVTIGIHQDITNFDPRIGNDVTSVFVNQLLYSSLVRISDELTIEPDLAESWETPSPTEYVFHLRKGVKFHDGEDLTASDVKYTYDSMRDPSLGSPNLSLYGEVESIDVIDDYTVRFSLSEPFPPLLYYLDKGIVPEHIASKERNALNVEPIGSGPYALKSWNANDRIVLSAFADYFEGVPGFPEVTFRIIIEDAVRLIEFEIGAIDVIYRIPYGDVQRIQDSSRYSVYAEAINGYGYFMMNHQAEPFNDVRVRKAIAYAINKEEMTELVYYGLYELADSPIIPQSWAYADDIVDYEEDLDEARRLLDEAGYPNGFDVTFQTYSQTDKVQFAEILASQLARVGINVSIEVSEWSQYFTRIVDRDFVFAGTQFWYYQTDPDQALYRQFHSEYTPPTGTNRHLYANARVDELLDLARTEPDQDVRAAYYREVQHILVDDVAYVFMWYPQPFHAAQANVTNPSFSPYTGYFDFVRFGSID